MDSLLLSNVKRNGIFILFVTKLPNCCSVVVSARHVHKKLFCGVVSQKYTMFMEIICVILSMIHVLSRPSVEEERSAAAITTTVVLWPKRLKKVWTAHYFSHKESDKYRLLITITFYYATTKKKHTHKHDDFNNVARAWKRESS